jgi:hypothetical protein
MSEIAKAALGSTFFASALVYGTPMPDVVSIPGYAEGEDLALSGLQAEDGWSIWLAAADNHGQRTLVRLTTAVAVQLRETLDALITEGETAGA